MPIPSGWQGTLLDAHRTIDHVKDSTRGGSDYLSNLVIACNHCNNARARQPKSIVRPMTENQFTEFTRGLRGLSVDPTIQRRASKQRNRR